MMGTFTLGIMSYLGCSAGLGPCAVILCSVTSGADPITSLTVPDLYVKTIEEGLVNAPGTQPLNLITKCM